MSKKTLIIILIVIGFLLYFRVLFNGFVWDDEEFLLNNPLVHSLGNIVTFFRGGSLDAGGSEVQSGAYYRPIMAIIYSTIYTAFGPNAFFFHLFQVATHIVNAILVFLLFEKNFLREYHELYDYSSSKSELRRTSREVLNSASLRSNSKILAFSLALVFLVHPMNVEAVSFVSATQEILYVMAGILALFFIDKIFLVALFLITSFLLKETGLIFAFIVFLYAAMFKRQHFRTYLLLTVFVVILFFIFRFTFARVPVVTQGLFPIMRATSLERFLTIPSIIFFYLKTFFLPYDLAIAQHWVVRLGILGWLGWLGILVGLGGLGIFVLKRKDKIGLFFFLWTLIGLLPHLQLIPLNMTVAERWFYLPMVGMLGIIGTIISKIKYQKSKIYFVILIILLAVRTILRTFDWKDGLTLYSHDIKVGQHTFDLENNLGVELFREGQFEKAKIHFEKSVKLATYWWVNWNNLGAVYERGGDLNTAENYYKKAIKNGDYYLAYENYALILIKQKKLKQAKEFLEKEALKKFPNNSILNQAFEFVSQQQF